MTELLHKAYAILLALSPFILAITFLILDDYSRKFK